VTGPVGIWCYNSSNVTIEYCESYNNTGGTGQDGGGFDLDINTSNSVIQYCYSHGNTGAGYLVGGGGSTTTGGNKIQYNVSQNDGLKNGYAGIHAWGNVTNDTIEGNWVFAQSPASAGIRIASGAKLTNLRVNDNVIFVTGALSIVKADTTAGVVFSGNDYWRSDGSFLLSWAGVQYTSLAAWKAASGQESGTGFNTSPPWLLTMPEPTPTPTPTPAPTPAPTPTPSPAPTPTPIPNEPVDKDFNGDGFSDLLLQNTTTGQHKVTLLSNGAAISSFNLPRTPLNWEMVGVGDFLGNGQTDPVLENSINGAHKIWVVVNGALKYQMWLPTARAWHVAGAADFNGDGQADLVLENMNTGGRTIWLLREGIYRSNLPLPNAGKNWRIAGTGDFFGNGQADLVLENVATGARTIWVLNNGVFDRSIRLRNVSASMHIAGAADINGDGQADLIFENTVSGRCVVWLMQNAANTGTIRLPTLTNGWEIANH
jgi:hypothetical protein